MATAHKLTERDLSKQICDFMQYRGWRKLRNNVGGRMGNEGQMIPFGERGMPDQLFLRYYRQPTGGALVLWIEMKRPGANMKCRCVPGDKRTCRNCQQRIWRDKERARGAVVIVADDLDEFCRWYDDHFGWVHSGPMADGQLRLIP